MRGVFSFLSRIIVPDVSSIRNQWLRENVSVLPLILVLTLSYCCLPLINVWILGATYSAEMFAQFFIIGLVVPLTCTNVFYLLSGGRFLKNKSATGRNWYRYLSLLAGLMMGIIISTILIHTIIEFDLHAPTRQDYQSALFNFFLFVILATPVFLNYIRKEAIEARLREKEKHLFKVEQARIKAELEALEAKINPHFLYNSLNSIAGLIPTHPEKAEKMVVYLSKFFRYSINSREDFFATVSDEMEIVNTYLDIEKVRYGDRLQIAMRIDPEVEQFYIPRFLLQPLVENAIKHGIAKITSKGIVDIRIANKDDGLEIIIGDNGPDFPEDFISGYGLKNIYNKLELLLKDRFHLSLLKEETKAISIFIRNPDKKWPNPSKQSSSKTKKLPVPA